MRSIRHILIVGLMMMVGGMASCRKMEWTKGEVIKWYANYGSMVRGGLGYQGSDAETHHFIARVMDDWAFFQIRKSELKLDDEHPFSRDSNAPLAYYAVDPSQDFRKIEAGIRVEPGGSEDRDQSERAEAKQTPRR